MKKQLILTQQQQHLVEDNHKLIYFYLYRNSLSVDEFYDVAAIGLCKAAITYNGQQSFQHMHMLVLNVKYSMKYTDKNLQEKSQWINNFHMI